MAKYSYFAEKRGHNIDPNYFNRVPLDDIKKNVRRIIKDIKYDNITEQDEIYFFNNKVITACIDVAMLSHQSCSVKSRALGAYLQNLNVGYVYITGTDINIERSICVEELNNETIRSNGWLQLLTLFQNIASLDYTNPESRDALKYYLSIIRNMNNNIINIL